MWFEFDLVTIEFEVVTRDFPGGWVVVGLEGQLDRSHGEERRSARSGGYGLLGLSFLLLVLEIFTCFME